MPLPRMQTPTSSRRAFSDVDSEDKHERLSFSPAPSLPLQLPLPTSSPLTITTSATTAINGSSDAVTPRRRSTPTPLVIDSNAYGGKLSEEQKEERKRKKKSSLKRSSTNTKDDDHSTSTAAAAHTPLSLTPASHISTPATTSTPIATAPTKPSFLSPPSSINSELTYTLYEHLLSRPSPREFSEHHIRPLAAARFSCRWDVFDVAIGLVADPRQRVLKAIEQRLRAVVDHTQSCFTMQMRRVCEERRRRRGNGRARRRAKKRRKSSNNQYCTLYHTSCDRLHTYARVCFVVVLFCFDIVGFTMSK